MLSTQQPQKRKISSVSTFKSRPPSSTYQKAFEQYLIEALVDCNMPFSVDEKPTFKNLLEFLQLSLNIDGNSYIL